MNATTIAQLRAIDACPEALAWLETQPCIATAWRTCQRGNWMLWLFGKLDDSEPWSNERKPIAAVVLDCALLTEPYLNDDSRLAFIWCCDALGRWIDGEDNRDEVDAASVAVSAAASADRILAECADIIRAHHPHPPRLP